MEMTFADIGGFATSESGFTRAGRTVDVGPARFVGFQTSVGVTHDARIDPPLFNKKIFY